MNWLESVASSPSFLPYLWLLVSLVLPWSIVAFVLDCRRHRRWLAMVEEGTDLDGWPESQPRAAEASGSATADHR